MKKTISIIIVLLLNSAFLRSQTKQSASDIAMYHNYLNLPSYISYIPLYPHWLKDGSHFWYSEVINGKNMIYVFDPFKNKKSELFDSKKFVNSLSKYVDSSNLNNGIPFKDFEFINNEKEIKFKIEKKEYVLNLSNYAITPSTLPNNIVYAEQIYFTDKKKFIFLKENNIWLGNSTSTESITTDGIQDNSWGITKDSWSFDGSKLLVQKSDTRTVFHLPVIDYSNAKEKVDWSVYAKTGDSIEKSDLFILDIATKKQTHINIKTEDYYIFPIGWRTDNSEVLFMRLERNGKTLELYGANPNTGICRNILTEKQKTFVAGLDFIIGNWHKQFTSLDGNKQFIWMSERDGWNHLYLYDYDGNLIRQITKGEFPVISVKSVDEKEGWIYFMANAEKHLYYTNLYRVNFNGEKIKKLTNGIGKHRIRFSPSQKYFIDEYSNSFNPPKTEIHSNNGKLISLLQMKDTTNLKKLDWKAPEPFVVKAADGTTDLYGIIYKPYNFDPSKKYPIVEFIYAGPIDPIVPTEFLPNTSLSIQAQALAQLGYITFLVDGRGTTERSKAFQDVIYRNIGKYEIPDHVATIKQLVAKRSYMDINRVGIFGHSWGGYFAVRAILFAPDIYKVGIASAPGELTEGAEINEPYMDLPANNKEGYDYGLNVNHAQNLQGKLLFIHGTADDNAPFSGTVRMIDALIKAGKTYDLLLLPQQTHFYEGIYDQYVNDAVLNYFEKNLK
ncbi:MAG: DPP IV N-terminal domain-containing protein [Bacteroidia bacterium]